MLFSISINNNKLFKSILKITKKIYKDKYTTVHGTTMAYMYDIRATVKQQHSIVLPLRDTLDLARMYMPPLA